MRINVEVDGATGCSVGVNGGDYSIPLPFVALAVRVDGTPGVSLIGRGTRPDIGSKFDGEAFDRTARQRFRVEWVVLAVWPKAEVIE